MNRAFEDQLVIAQQITVVTSEYDHCVFGDAEIIQLSQHLADRIIDHCNHAAGKCHHFSDFLFAGCCKQALSRSHLIAVVAALESPCYIGWRLRVGKE